MPQSKDKILRQAPLLDFFPPIKPYNKGFLSVDDPHEIYWEECGNPDGVPIVFLHGGPGAGCSDILRQFFDPDYFRIILFDQRGSGRSTPAACLENNTTDDLIGDIEQLRQHLDIEKWHVFGGSWGSTLALSYASEKPKRVLSMTLRGIFLMEQADIKWFMHTNKHVFPEAWEQFASIIPKDRHDDLLEAYYERLTGDNEEQKMEAAINWSLYEGACSRLIPNYEIITTDDQKQKALCLATLECHYFRNNYIKDEDSLLKKVDRFRHIPTTITQGRYDMVCPILSAHRLHDAWPEAEYNIIPDAGHSALEPAIRSHLIEATENLKTL